MNSDTKILVSKVLIIGAGMTGSVTARLINDEALADIEVWEKLDYTGGRFLTYRDPDNPKCAFDAGAQYVSVTLEVVRKQAKLYDEMTDKNLLIPLNQKIDNFRKLSETKQNFVAPDGLDSLVSHFLKTAGAKVQLGHEVKEINLNDSEKKWDVTPMNGDVEQFDVVIIALPAPEVLKIQGNFLNLCDDEDVKLYLEQVSYWPRISAGLMYSEPLKFFEEFPTPMKYFPKDDVLHFLSLDHRKRGKDNDCPVLLIQTSKQFSTDNMDKDEKEIQSIILDHLNTSFPDLPNPSSVKITKWPYGQVKDAYIDSPGCIVLNKHPMLLCGGDSFTETHFNGCVRSAVHIVEELLKTVSFSKNQRKKSSAT